MSSKRTYYVFLCFGLILGLLITLGGGLIGYKVLKDFRQPRRYGEKVAFSRLTKLFSRGGAKGSFVSFEQKEDFKVVQPDGGALAELTDSHATHGRKALLVTLPSGESFPGLLWEAYGSHVQDWTGAPDFHFDVYNNTEDFINLTVKFKSGRSYPKVSFERAVQLEPLQMNHIRIPTADIASVCDLSSMSYIKVFATSPEENLYLYFDSWGTREGDLVDGVVPEGDSIQGTEAVDVSNLSDGYTVFAAPSFDRIFRDGQTLGKPHAQDRMELSLAANEYESFQIAVRNGKNRLEAVSLVLTDLVNPRTGAVLDKEYMAWNVVGYVPTKKPYYPVKYVGLWPDPLLPAEPVTVEPGMAQPLWLTVYVPPGTRPGNYQGVVTLMVDGEKAEQIPLSVQVFDFQLPEESHLKTAFDYYAHITYMHYPKREQESEEAYRSRLSLISDAFIEEMIKHRMDPVLNLDLNKGKDLRRLEKFISAGMNQFAVGRHGGTFNNNWPKSDEELEQLLPVYRAYGEFLEERDLLERHYMYTWDEGKIGDPFVMKITDMIRRAFPKLKNMVCYHGFWDPEEFPAWGENIDIWCFQISSFNYKMMQTLMDRGMEIWMYVSGPSGDGTPNLAMDFDSVDYRIIPWMCWKYEIQGFLYWSVNYWENADPFETAANTKWDQNGNGLLFYPGTDGPLSSVRASIYRDGMEDYEYLYLLKSQIALIKKMGVEAEHRLLMREADALIHVDKSIAKSLRNFTKDPLALTRRRESLAGMIEQFDQIIKFYTNKNKVIDEKK